MPYCPSCRYEYMDFVSKCPDCDEFLVEHLPEENKEPDGQICASGETVQVYVANNAMEAQMIKELLESHGIQVWSNANRDFSNQLMQSYSLFAHSSFDIFVEESDAEEAAKLIEEAQNSADESPPSEDDWLKPSQ